MKGKEVTTLAESFKGGDLTAGDRLQELPAGLIAALVLHLRDARKFRGNGETHTAHEITENGDCWICGRDFGHLAPPGQLSILIERKLGGVVVSREEWFGYSEETRQALTTDSNE